jgi:nitrite reductase/ring-hydroxylating ferredoxin subunit
VSEASVATEPAAEATFDAGPLSERPEGEFRIVEIYGRSVGLLRRGDRVHAVRNICPHKTAPVCKGKLTGTMLPSAPGEFEYGFEGEVLQCPWHGWQFSLETGEALYVDVRNRLRVYVTEVRDGRVLVHLRGRPPRAGTQAS